jgi:polar amino acid transport system substrate-binding protein
MLQIVQHQKSGKVQIEQFPDPLVREGFVLVRNRFSLISAGTEKVSVESAQSSLANRARNNPELVKAVFDIYQKEGLKTTIDKVMNRLDSFKELGYSSAGVVLVSGVDSFKPGDRVACGGAGFALHAEMVCVPKNLVVRIPDEVTFEEAAFTTLGAIAMQGVRQADVRVGERVAVIGLGLLGMITTQLLKASGCFVIGLDINKDNFHRAKQCGCDAVLLSSKAAIKQIESLTHGAGTDAVIITASTSSNDPLELAIKFARKKSNVVVVGSVGMNVPRSPFYEKELDIKISCSYGPGRYDPVYEEQGHDYPIGYVRWTETRNMESVLHLISERHLDVHSLITHVFPIKEAAKAYDIITGKQPEPHIGMLIKYPEKAPALVRLELRPPDEIKKASLPVVGFIGAGNFAQSNLLPPLRSKGVRLKGVATADPLNAASVGKKFGFEFAASEPGEVLNDREINALFIATRHDSHAKYVMEGLKNGKHIFVEKPLSASEKDLLAMKKLFENDDNVRSLVLSVGFNRRFSPVFKDIKEFFTDVFEPKVMHYRVNAGFIPATHWVQSPEQRGRIVGEVCHFIDCMNFITDALPVSVYAESIRSDNVALKNEDSVSLTLAYSDGSVASILYLANGDSSVPKEYCEIYGGGKTAIMNNFTDASFHAGAKTKKKTYNGKKGHEEELSHFLSAVRGEVPPEFSFESLYYTTLATFKALESLINRNKIVL